MYISISNSRIERWLISPVGNCANYEKTNGIFRVFLFFVSKFIEFHPSAKTRDESFQQRQAREVNSIIYKTVKRMEAIKTIYRKKKEGRGKLGARRERLASVNASREITIKIGGERLFAEKRRGKSGGNRSGRNIPADDSSQFSSDSSDRRDSFLSVKRSNVYRSVSYQSGASPIKTKPTTQEESNTRSFLTSTSDLFSPLPLSLSLGAPSLFPFVPSQSPLRNR